MDVCSKRLSVKSRAPLCTRTVESLPSKGGLVLAPLVQDVGVPQSSIRDAVCFRAPPRAQAAVHCTEEAGQ